MRVESRGQAVRDNRQQAQVELVLPATNPSWASLLET